MGFVRALALKQSPMRLGFLLGLLALPPLWAACSGQVSSGGPVVGDGDAGSAGAAGAPNAPEYDSGLKNTDCSLLTVEQCAAGKDCQVIEAQLRSPTCQSGLEAVGCSTISQGCGDALTRAKDPDGRVWLFRTTCIPHGWTALPSTADEPCGLGGAAN